MISVVALVVVVVVVVVVVIVPADTVFCSCHTLYATMLVCSDSQWLFSEQWRMCSRVC